MSRSELRGPSADALEALSDRLGPSRGVLPTETRFASRTAGGGDEDDPTEMARMGEDLFGVASVFRTEPGLRRIATDSSIEADAKTGLVRGLLEGKIAGSSMDLVAEAVQRRWTRPGDLAEALEHLGVVAVVKSAGDDSERLSDELFVVGRLIEEQHDLRTALSDPARSAADKGRLLRDLLEDRTLPATQRLAAQAVSGSHRSATSAIEEYQRVAAAVHGQRVAQVWVAHELSGSEAERLQDALSSQYGRTVHLNVVVDPAIIGGMRVEIGDEVIDGTVSGRLDEARRRLAG